MNYLVHLKSTEQPVPVEADKFVCERGCTAFYSRPGPGQKFEETAAFSTSNIKSIQEN